MKLTYVSHSPLQHTYPFSAHDVTIPFADADTLRTQIADVFKVDPECRRVVVAVTQDDAEVATCEEAGMRYVLEVQLRDGSDVSLMVAEPRWVLNQSTDIKDLNLS